MRFLKLFSVVISVMLVFSLAACEEQGSPSAGELADDNGTVSTDFDPNFHIPKKEPEVIKYTLNVYTGIENLPEKDLVKAPMAIVVANDPTHQAGVNKADLVYEAEIEGGTTNLLAAFISAPSDLKIGPAAMGREVFADLSLSLSARLACHGVEADHAQNLLNGYTTDYINLTDGLYAALADGALYTNGAFLDVAAKDQSLSAPADLSPWSLFSTNRPASETVANKVKVTFNATTITEFVYNPESKTYHREINGAPVTDCFTGEMDNYTNLFVLNTQIIKYKDCEHLGYTLQSGSGYYVSGGGYEPITWERFGPAGPISFKDKDGNMLYTFAGRSYIALVNQNTKNTFTVE